MPSNSLFGLWAAVVFSLAAVGPTYGGEEEQLGMVSIAPSERLQTIVLGRALRKGIVPFTLAPILRKNMERQAYYFSGDTPSIISASFRVSPILTYDGNINGGLSQNQINISGYTFNLDPAYRKKSGLVGGGSAGGEVRVAWSEGRYLSLAGQAASVWSPRYDIGRSDAAVALCSKNNLTGWTFADICQTVGQSWRDLGNIHYQETALQLAQIAELAGNVHEGGLKISEYQSDDWSQDRLGVSLKSVWDSFTDEISITYGKAVEGETVPRYILTGGVSWLSPHNRPWQMDVRFQRAAGGAFLGEPRVEYTTSFGLSTQLSTQLSFNFDYSRVNSTASYANLDQVSFGFQFRGKMWSR